MKWLSRALLLAVLAGLIVTLMLYLNGTFSPKVSPAGTAKGDSPSAPPAQWAEARFIDVPDIEQAPGTIRPLHETALSSKVREPEKLVEMNVIAGQEVHKGDLLARLDSSVWENRKEMAAAKLKSATASRDDAQKNFDRIKDAYGKGVATTTEHDTAKYRLESAESELVAAQRAVDEADMNLGYTKILAPMDAVVIDKRADVGDTVAPGQVLVSLYDKTQMIANVREGLMRHLKTGQSIGVYIDDVAASCVGTISEIVPQADPVTRTFLVKVVGKCHAGVRPGMYAKLLVSLGDKKILVIPSEAVVRVGQLTMVDVAAGNEVERRNVQLGRRLEFDGKQYVEVLSGLKAGENVALNSAEQAYGE